MGVGPYALQAHSRWGEALEHCLLGQGIDQDRVDMLVSPPNTGSSPVEDSRTPRERVAEDGSGLVLPLVSRPSDPPADIETGRSPALAPSSDLPTEEERGLLYGLVEFDDRILNGGCVQFADSSVDTEGISELRTSLSTAYEAAMVGVFQDPMLLDSEDAWSRCMAQAGFSYRSPADVADDLFERVNSSSRSQLSDDSYLSDLLELDRQVSLASFDCDEEVGLRHTRLELAQKYFDDFVHDHGSDIDSLRAAVRAVG